MYRLLKSEPINEADDIPPALDQRFVAGSGQSAIVNVHWIWPADLGL